MTAPQDDYTLAELMCIQAARELPPTGVVMLGMGLPVLAGTLAKLMHAPGISLCTEVGAFDWSPSPDVTRAPIGIHDFNLNDGAAMVTDMVDALGTLLMGGNVDVGILGAAQVDRYGNLNTMVMGDYRAPERRLGGTGGNTEIACLAKRRPAISWRAAAPVSVPGLMPPGSRRPAAAARRRWRRPPRRW
jgi:glutaconate CoA-transferase subunit B